MIRSIYRPFTGLLTCALLLSWCACSAWAQPVFHIRPVPLTQQGTSNQARGINDQAILAGYENIAGGFQRAVFGDTNNVVSAGLAPYSTPMTSSEGHAINNQGILVGVGRYSAPPPGSTTGSVPYDRGIVFNTQTQQFLAVLEPFNDSGGRRAFAQAINNQNRVVGNGSNDPVLTNQNPRRAFWYDVDPGQSPSTYRLNGNVNGLPFLPGGSWSVAYDINDQQAIVGFAQAPDDAPNPVNRNRAVIWEAGLPDPNGNPYSTVTRLDLRNDAGTSSLARAINATGTVVGRMTLSATAGDETAFVHRPGDNGISSLGFFGSGNTRTEAIDVGNNGWIVGYAGVTEGDSSNNNRALLWVPDPQGIAGYQAYDLLSLLDTADPFTAGWTKLLEARGLNADGTIVGYGRYRAVPGGPEVTRGFVLTVVPEPNAPVLAALIVLSLLTNSSRHRRLI